MVSLHITELHRRGRQKNKGFWCSHGGFCATMMEVRSHQDHHTHWPVDKELWGVVHGWLFKLPESSSASGELTVHPLWLGSNSSDCCTVTSAVVIWVSPDTCPLWSFFFIFGSVYYCGIKCCTIGPQVSMCIWRIQLITISIFENSHCSVHLTVHGIVYFKKLFYLLANK